MDFSLIKCKYVLSVYLYLKKCLSVAAGLASFTLFRRFVKIIYKSKSF